MGVALWISIGWLIKWLLRLGIPGLLGLSFFVQNQTGLQTWSWFFNTHIQGWPVLSIPVILCVVSWFLWPKGGD